MRPFYLLMILVLAFQLHGQSTSSFESVASSGTLTNENLSVSFSMGTPLIGAHANELHLLQYGLLYQYELEVVLATETLSPAVELSVFPNPVTRTLNVRVDTSPVDAMNIQLFDIKGYLLLESELNDFHQETSMDLTHFQEGVYLLKVVQNNLSNTYKIIKNK